MREVCMHLDEIILHGLIAVAIVCGHLSHTIRIHLGILNEESGKTGREGGREGGGEE